MFTDTSLLLTIVKIVLTLDEYMDWTTSVIYEEKTNKKKSTLSDWTHNIYGKLSRLKSMSAPFLKGRSVLL